MNVTGNPRGPSLVSGRLGVGSGGLGSADKLVNGSAAAELELSFYANPPDYELSLDEFEELALARLKVRARETKRKQTWHIHESFSVRETKSKKGNHEYSAFNLDTKEKKFTNTAFQMNLCCYIKLYVRYQVNDRSCFRQNHEYST